VPLLVGLGNPGDRYVRTRHNIGWRVLDLLAERLKARPYETTRYSEVWRAVRGAGAIDLMKPLTFMNLSGEAIADWSQRHPLGEDGMLVITDDVYLPLGMLRLRARGSSGGHKGLDSIAATLGHEDFARLRIGVGAAEDGSELREHVLETFDTEEERHAQEAIAIAADAADCWIREGIGPAMNRFNRRVRKEVSES
jgi:PTH1 family peptidyl-tRNA hydrolase